MTETTHHKQGVLLAALAPEAGYSGYALNLSKLAQAQRGPIVVELASAQTQRIVFRKADDYGVTVQHDANLGVYFVSGEASKIAKFLQSVKLVSDAHVVSHIVMDIGVTPQTGEHAWQTREYKLAVHRNNESGEPSTTLFQHGKSSGVSQVVQESQRQSIADDGQENESANGVAIHVTPLQAPDIPTPLSNTTAEELTFTLSSLTENTNTENVLKVADAATDAFAGASGGQSSTINGNPPPVPEPDAEETNEGTGTQIQGIIPGDIQLASPSKAAPVLSDLAHTLTAINEDILNAANTGTLVSNVLQAGSLTLAGTGQPGIAVIGVDNTNGTWEYKLPAGAWTAIAATGDNDALLLADDALLRFVPDADYDGTADITFRAWDRTDGSNSGDTKDIAGELGGANQAFSIASDTAEITVTPVTDAPTFTSTATELAEETVLYSYAITTTDPDADPVTITAPTLPGWLGLVDNGDGTATLSGTPGNGDRGDNSVVLEVDDGTNTTQQTFSIFVTDDGYFGGGGNDTVNGTSGSDYMYGGDGDDNLSGQNQDDSINGGDGDDTIDGGNNEDTLEGGNGNDSLNGGVHPDILDGGAGQDTLTGGTQQDLFIFSDLTHSTSAAPDLITDYEALTDYIFFDGLGITGIGAGATEVTITDNGTNTFISHNSSTFQIELSGVYAASDLLLIFNNFTFGTQSADTINGTAVDDVILGWNGNDVINGGDGNDTIDGGYNNDTIDGGNGNDLLFGYVNYDSITGGDGDDTIDGGNNEDTLEGGNGNDSLNGGVHPDILDGGAGQDTLTGGTQQDLFIFSDLTHSTSAAPNLITDYVASTDYISLDGLGITGIGVGATEVTITDNGTNTFISHNSSTFQIELKNVYAASDLLLIFDNFTLGTTSAETINGTAVDDVILGWAGNDTLNGGDGDDTLDGGYGNDTIDGGNGNDLLIGYVNYDSITGGDGDDTIDGGSSEDTLEGGNGNDSIDGDLHHDVLDGGAGQDTLTGGTQADVFIFSNLTHSTSAAPDLITDYSAAEDHISLDGLGITGIGVGATEVTITDNGTNTFISHNSSTFQIELSGVYTASDLFLIFDNFSLGTISAETINGTAVDDAILGWAGNDTLTGGDGNDTIDGGYGTDDIDGGNGNDKLIGDVHNDTLNGGSGQDTLTGGNNNDTFVLDQSTVGHDDNITDFNDSGTDIIALSDAVFVFSSGEGAKNGVALTDNTDIFDTAGFAGGSFGAGGGATFLYDTTDGELWYDADGDGGGGAAVLIATLDNFATYTYDANDFEGWA